MTIQPDDLKHLEDSLVHDEDEEPVPEGWGMYVTPKFLSRMVLVSYGLMMVGVAAAQMIYSGHVVPVVLMPGALLIALPFAVVGLYLNFVSDSETALVKKRTTIGRVITFITTYIGLQIFTMALWVGASLAFKLH